MENPNRISPTSITPTTGRQTPQNDFGTVLARTVSTAVTTGAGIAGGMAMGHPVLSAAVSSVASVASAAVSTVGSNGSIIGGAPAAGGSTGVGGSTGAGENDSFALLEAQKLLKEEERKFNLEYLNLQNALQRESREFNAVSNIMKVRHDSAKAAINNIR